MSVTTDQATSTAGLIYRARHNAPHQPLILMLHGLYGDENVMWLFDHALPRSATVISPRAPFASAEGYRWTRSAVRDEVGQVDFTEALEVVPRFILEMTQRYECDPQRVVAMGFSQGAALSYALSLARPDLLCGVIVLAGFMPDGLAESKSAPRHGYLIIHSPDDDIVPIALAREARSVLEARGALVEYHEYPGRHKIAARGMKEITRWLERILW
jgi:phospholipase/carboxylesterase